MKIKWLMKLLLKSYHQRKYIMNRNLWLYFFCADITSWFGSTLDFSPWDPRRWSYIVSLNLFKLFTFIYSMLNPFDQFFCSFEDEKAGEIPVAFVVRKPGSKLTSEEVMEFVAKQVISSLRNYYDFVMLELHIFWSI